MIFQQPNGQYAEVTTSLGLPVTQFRPGTPVDVSATAAAGAQASVTIPAATGKFSYLVGITLSWDASGTGSVSDTLTVTAGGTTLSFRFATAAGAGGSLVVPLPNVTPGTQNTAVTVSTGNPANRAACALVAHGFTL